MKINVFYFMFAALLVSIIACDKENNNDPTLAELYLPLEVGNYWQLDYSQKREIIGTKDIDNKLYFVMAQNNDSSYYRIENNNILLRGYEDGEDVKFDLNAKENDSWSYYSYTVTLVSISDTIIINDSKITNCYQFYFNIPEMVDEEHSIWLAPGIGFVQEQCGECLHQIIQLDKAKIGDQIIDY